MNIKEKACTANAGSKTQKQQINTDYTENTSINVYLSVFTSDDGKLSKSVFLNDKGVIRKSGGGILAAGQYQKHTIDGLKELDDLLNTLTTDQAVAYGIADIDAAPIRTTENVCSNVSAIARNKDTFKWPEGAGIFMIDYDPEDEATPLSPKELHTKITAAMPELANIEMLWRPSASSCIHHSETGQILSEITGQRLYFIVDQANSIGDIGETLLKRLWLSGSGYIAISESSSLLVRTIVDGCVWQPERLDFAAGANCIAPLERRPVKSTIFAGKPVLKAKTVTKLRDDEEKQYKILIADAKEAIKPKQLAVREAYIDRRVAELIGPDASEEQKANAKTIIANSLDDKILFADYVLHLPGNIKVTVAEVLADKDKYHKTILHDPLEPDYRGGNNAKFFLNGKSEVYSWAHGGRTFKLTNAMPQEDDDTIIKRMAALTLPEYDRTRKDQAKVMGIQIKTLDAVVEAERKKLAVTDEIESIVEQLEPWGDVVNAAELLDTMEKILTDHIKLPTGGNYAVPLWILSSYCMDAWVLFPKLYISSPLPRCGKTTMLEVLECFSCRALFVSNITSSATFRCIELYQPTLMFDEADTYLKQNDEMNGIINAGQKKRGAFVVKSEAVERTYEPKKFSVWCPQIIAGIGEQRVTLHDRSICIPLRRKLSSEKVDKFPADGYEQGKDFRRKCMKWALDNMDKLKASKVKVPSCGNDRAQDNWRPLFAIAEAAGGDWPKKVESAYLAINVTANNNAPENYSAMLLADVQEILKGHKPDKISSADLVKKLIALQDRPWAEISKGQPLTQNKLAKMLDSFHCKPKTIRAGKTTEKGYTKSSFDDAFARYLRKE